MLKSSPKKVISLIVVAALVAAAVAVAVGTATAHQSRRLNARHVAIPHELAARVAANRTLLARRFPLLTAARAASSASLALPDKYATEFAEQASKPVPPGALGEPDPALAVYVGSVSTTVDGTLNVWAIPGPNDLCIAKIPTTERGAGVECQSNADAAAGGLVGIDEGSDGSSTEIGLLPGSVAQVTIHQSTGADVVAPATAGLWVVNNDPQAVAVSATSVDGTVPIPSSVGR
jgi:hypothetical protein